MHSRIHHTVAGTLALGLLLTAAAAWAATDAPVTPVVSETPAGDAAPAAAPAGPERNAHRIGLGANYWKTVDNIGEDFDSHGLSYLASYQYMPVWFFKVEAAVELYPDLDKTSKPLLAPELYLIAGGLFYAGAGVGIYYRDGMWGSDPFFMLRAGLDVPVLKNLFLDLNANYRFNDWGTFAGSDLKSNSIRLGAALRYAL